MKQKIAEQSQRKKIKHTKVTISNTQRQNGMVRTMASKPEAAVKQKMWSPTGDATVEPQGQFKQRESCKTELRQDSAQTHPEEGGLPVSTP